MSETGLWHDSFRCFACPCEVLVETTDQQQAEHVLRVVECEAKCIEHKFSRYHDDNLVCSINHAEGQPVTVDEETTHTVFVQRHGN